MAITINKKMIDFYGKDRLIKVFTENDQRGVMTQLVARLNRNYPNRDVKATDFSLLDGFEDYIIDGLLFDPTKRNDQIIPKYRELLYSLFKQKPEIAYDSKMFNKEVAAKFFTAEQIREIAEYKLRESNKAIQELTSAFKKKGETISKESIRIALYQIKCNNVQDGKLCDKLYNYLLNNMETNDNIFAKEYILIYTGYLASKDLNIPMPNYYLITHKLDANKMPANNLGACYGNDGIIVINRELVNNNFTIDSKIPSIIKFMQTSAHETRHASQYHNEELGSISLMTFDTARQDLFRNYLSSSNYDEYRTNYMHSEIESDANLYGWRYTFKLISKRVTDSQKYTLPLSINEVETKYKETTSTKKRATGERFESWRYNVKCLDDIVAKHPELINNHATLGYIYTKDGKRISIFEMLEKEENNKGLELDKIYNDYYLNFFMSDDFDKLDIPSLNLEEKFLIFGKILNIVDSECEKLKDSMKMYQRYKDAVDKRKSEFDYANKQRTARIKKLLNYLSKHQHLTDGLRWTDTYKDHNKRAFGFRMSVIDRRLDELRYYLGSKIETLGINESGIADELKSIKEVKFDGRNSKERTSTR